MEDSMRQKKSYEGVLLVSIVVFAVLVLTGCFEGYIGSEGEVLKQYLPPEKLQALITNPDDAIWIIDVRPASAYQKGHIPTARSFPSSEIFSRLGEISKDKYLIVYCETGGRAQGVIKKLEKKGYTRFMNWGGISRWPYEQVEGAE
jgi:rhodanese-related sulfurtransferase